MMIPMQDTPTEVELPSGDLNPEEPQDNVVTAISEGSSADLKELDKAARKQEKKRLKALKKAEKELSEKKKQKHRELSVSLHDAAQA
jgi:hypothetical protein